MNGRLKRATAITPRSGMEYLPLTDADAKLIEEASSLIRRAYLSGKHHVGAAVKAKSGKTYTGVHLESRAVDICAEAVAIGAAASSGERQFDSIVAVTMAQGEAPHVISPCGTCRELINFYGPDISVIFVENGEIRKCRAGDLLPGPYAGSV